VITIIESFPKDVLVKGKIASTWTDSLFMVYQKASYWIIKVRGFILQLCRLCTYVSRADQA